MKLYVVVINDIDFNECEADASVHKKATVDRQEAFNEMCKISDQDLADAKYNGWKDACLEVDDENMERTLYDSKDSDHRTHYQVQEIEA